MKNTVDLAPVLTFLKHLEKNNNRTYFEANRPEILLLHLSHFATCDSLR
jgi:hypothetical protein